MTWAPRALEQYLVEAAGTRGDAEALVTQTARLSYEDLLQRARSAAGSMQALGIKPGDPVGILMGNDERWL